MPPRRSRKYGINLTPLIDVVFLVLAFLMVFSRLDTQTALNVDLPGINGTGTKASSSVSLTIDKDGSLYFGKEGIELRDVADRINKLGDEVTLTIRSDRAAPAGVLVEVLDILQEANVTTAQIAAISADSSD